MLVPKSIPNTSKPLVIALVPPRCIPNTTTIFFSFFLFAMSIIQRFEEK